MLYLLVGDTECMEKNLFCDVIGHQQLSLVWSAFLCGDSSSVGVCSDPSSSCKGSGFKTSQETWINNVHNLQSVSKMYTESSV